MTLNIVMSYIADLHLIYSTIISSIYARLMLNSSVVRLARSQLTTRPEREFIDEISLTCNATAKLNFSRFDSIDIRIDFAMIEIYVYCICF